jgi:hypothetical protein
MDLRGTREKSRREKVTTTGLRAITGDRIDLVSGVDAPPESLSRPAI